MRALRGCMVTVVVLTCGLGYAQDLTWVTWAEEAGGNGHEYAIVGTEASWDEQNAAAAAEGAWLVDFTSQEETNFVKLLTLADYVSDRPSTRYYWIGLVQDPEGDEPFGGWGWSSGEPLDFVNWPSYGDPNDLYGIEDVGAMYYFSGTWVDNPAALAQRAVLERGGVPADDTPPELSLDAPIPGRIAPPNGRKVSVAVTGSATDHGTGVAQARLVVDDEYDLLDGEFDVTALLDADGGFTIAMDMAATCDVDDADGRTCTITLHAVDGAGKVATPVTEEVVVPPDTTLPVVTLDSPEPSILWPPDREYVVAINGQAFDNETSIASVTLVVEDEYGDYDGEQDITGLLDENGFFSAEIVVGGSVSGRDADGRAFIVWAEAVDAFGNENDPVSVTVSLKSPRRGGPGGGNGNGPKK